MMVEHFARLDRWPTDLQIPDSLADRFRYDAGTRRLLFRGFMSKIEFDKLNRLCDDWPYRRALEELFREATPEPEAEAGSRRPLGQRLAGFLHGIGLT